MPGRVGVGAGHRFRRRVDGFGVQLGQGHRGEDLGRWRALPRQQRSTLPRDEPGIDPAGSEIRMGGDAAEQVEVGDDAGNVAGV